MEETETELLLQELDADAVEVETVIDFAVGVLSTPSSFWIDSAPDQKQRFQQILFPAGIDFEGKNFGTEITSFIFKYLPSNPNQNSSLASRTGIEPVSPP